MVKKLKESIKNFKKSNGKAKCLKRKSLFVWIIVFFTKKLGKPYIVDFKSYLKLFFLRSSNIKFELCDFIDKNSGYYSKMIDIYNFWGFVAMHKYLWNIFQNNKNWSKTERIGQNMRYYYNLRMIIIQKIFHLIKLSKKIL